MGRNLVRASIASLCGLALAACENSNTLVLDPNPAVTVQIQTPRCPALRRCGRCTLDTQAFDKNGQPALFPTLLWTSSAPDVATVEGNTDGTATVDGWSTGSTTIRVEVLETGAEDELELSVLPSLQPVNCSPPGALQPAADGTRTS